MSARLGSKAAELKRVLGNIADAHPPAALASSLSAEDMVITDAILTANLGIEIFTIDTGRLHGDTLDLLDAIRTCARTRCLITHFTTRAIARLAARRALGRR
jgi:phosphoadenosine phosphosulfate reductase